MPSLYETHVPVSDLARSSAFYRDIVGLVPAFSQPGRGAAFFWVGDKSGGMVGLWEPQSPWGWKAGERYRCHLSIQITLPELHVAIKRLAKLNVDIRGFDGTAACEPSVIGWMPSAQIYFDDPDGHSIEFISLLDDPAVPSFFGTMGDWLAFSASQQSLRTASIAGGPDPAYPNHLP